MADTFAGGRFGEGMSKVKPGMKHTKEMTRRLVDIESKGRLSSREISALGNEPVLLREYLGSSITNTFSELMFRLTYERYDEKKAEYLWHLITDHRESLKRILGRDMGMLVAALDYLSNISKDITNPKIMDDIRIEETAKMATRDTLTGLYLRGVFDFMLDRLILEHAKLGRPMCLLLIDLDDFKIINDRHGHQRGDLVLQESAALLTKNCRCTDILSRFGGEELAVILPETTLKVAIKLADRLRRGFLQHFTDEDLHVTISIGISSINGTEETTGMEMVRQADKALYKAKDGGKNRVEKYP